MRRDENMVGAAAAVPKGKLERNKINGGGDEGAGVADGGEAIDGAEVAGDVNGDEEEVGLPRLERPNVAAQQGPVDGHLRREQMVAAPLVCQPVGVEFRRQFVDVDFHSVERPFTVCILVEWFFDEGAGGFVLGDGGS